MSSKVDQSSLWLISIPSLSVGPTARELLIKTGPKECKVLNLVVKTKVKDSLVELIEDPAVFTLGTKVPVLNKNRTDREAREPVLINLLASPSIGGKVVFSASKQGEIDLRSMESMRLRKESFYSIRFTGTDKASQFSIAFNIDSRPERYD